MNEEHPMTQPAAEDFKRTLRSIPSLNVAEGVESSISSAVQSDNRHRSQCRADAMTIVTRARQRKGSDLTVWTPDDVDTVYAIAELLMRLK